MKTLLDCMEGESIILHSFSLDTNHDFINDLMDYGLLPGTSVTLYPHFPYSDKVVLKVGDCMISIRKQDAKNIFIYETILKDSNERPV